MSYSDDLDWLARNVHDWPDSSCIYIHKMKIKGITYPSWSRYAGDGKFTKQEWLSRRAELQNKLSWDQHSWPQIFQNEDGHWFGARDGWDFYAHIGRGWKGDGVSMLRDDGEYLQTGTVLGDWRDTLEKRPEEFQPFTSIEDNQEKDMKQDNGWHDRGELPPVGIKCEFNAGPFGWFVCDIVAHYNGDAVFSHEEDVSRGKPGEFRPIRTERDEAIKAMKAHCPYPGSWETTYRLFAEALYDAGYRAGGSE